MRMNLQDNRLKDLRKELKELAMELGLDEFDPVAEAKKAKALDTDPEAAAAYVTEERAKQAKYNRFDQIADEIERIIFG